MTIIKQISWFLLCTLCIVILLAAGIAALGSVAPELPNLYIFWTCFAGMLILAFAGPVGVFSKKLGFTRRLSITSAAGFFGLLLASAWVASANFQKAPSSTVVVKDQRISPKYWILSTGSKIAYWYFPAVSGARSIPIIVLHGGPGASTLTAMLKDFPQAFNSQGFDVYFYDQIGSGSSARLLNPTDYTLKRMTSDLEAIRQSLGAERVLLIAASWGAVIAGRYAATYPAHVAGMGLLSPAPVDGVDYRSLDFSKTNQNSVILPTAPRLVTALALLRWSPHLTQGFMSQEESSLWATSFIGAQMSAALDCKSEHPTRTIVVSGANLYPYSLLQSDIVRAEPVMSKLSEKHIPTIIFRGECDYLPRTVAKSYATALKPSRIHDIVNEGHGLTTKLADIANTTVRWFLEHSVIHKS